MFSSARAARRHILISVLAAFMTSGVVSASWAFDSGKGKTDVKVQDVEITVFTYRPTGCVKPALLFVFHGLGRKAGNIRNNATKLADHACLLVLAPLFDRERFPNWRYHRAGVVKKDQVQPQKNWTGPIVNALIAWGRGWAGDPTAPYILFGHSAGGQFLSRLSAYSPPGGASRIVIANPSAHVLPSFDEVAPYGFGGVYSSEEAEDRLRAYLTLPITIYLGAQDVGEKNLVKKSAARQQGANRLERGFHVFRRAWELANEEGWQLNWRLVTAPGVGHSSRDMLNAPNAEDALGLFDRSETRMPRRQPKRGLE